MQLFEQILDCYGWWGVSLIGVIFMLFCVQLYYYLYAYGRLPGYKNNRRKPLMEQEPPLSVIVPMFSEDCTFVEERLPLILAQNYHEFEVIIVYVGNDRDFYDDLERLRQSFPQIYVTKIHFDARFPISRKMALNVGIKSAHHECMVFTSTNAMPQTDRWLSLIAKGFTRGEVVVGYCGLEQQEGVASYLMRTSRMMHSVAWLSRAVLRRPYRGTLHNMGFTKTSYYRVNGFGNLNMNIGEDDLFLQQVMTRENVSVVLSPRATLREKQWGKMGWWHNQQRYYCSSYPLYPLGAKNFVEWEAGSRLLFFLAIVCALVVLPVELKLVAGLLLLMRYLLVVIQVRRIANRLGEQGVVWRYFLYDLISPIWDAGVRISLFYKDKRVWR